MKKNSSVTPDISLRSSDTGDITETVMETILDISYKHCQNAGNCATKMLSARRSPSSTPTCFFCSNLIGQLITLVS